MVITEANAEVEQDSKTSSIFEPSPDEAHLQLSSSSPHQDRYNDPDEESKRPQIQEDMRQNSESSISNMTADIDAVIDRDGLQINILDKNLSPYLSRAKKLSKSDQGNPFGG